MRKGEFTPQADRFYAAADTGATCQREQIAHQAHRRGGRGHSVRGLLAPTAPNAVKITDEASVAALIVGLDQPRRFLHAAQDLVLIALKMGADPQPIDAVAR